VTYTGLWTHDNNARVWSEGVTSTSNEPGATATFSFTGTSVSWTGCEKGSAGGVANIYLDGSLGLANAPHTLKIQVTRTDGSYVVVDAFDVHRGRARFCGMRHSAGRAPGVTSRCRPGGDNMRRLSIALLVVFAWLAAALAVDRLLMVGQCPACVHLAALQVKLRMPAGEITYPQVSLLVLVVLPVLLFALAMAPWRDLRSRQAWSHAIESWWEPSFWLLVALVLTIVGESLYLVAREYIPAQLTTLAERFTLTATASVQVPGHPSATPLALTASAVGLACLALGAYLFLRNGLNGVMRWFKA